MSRSSVSKKAVSALIFSAAAFACAGAYAQDHMRTQTQTPIYGSQLMTDAERVAYQSKMRSLKTTAEKEAFRLDHHEQMKVRAAEKGLTLPDAPMMKNPTRTNPLQAWAKVLREVRAQVQPVAVAARAQAVVLAADKAVRNNDGFRLYG